MPLPIAIAAGLIAGGTALAGTAGNIISKRRQNKKSQQHEIDMYERQRRDNLEYWSLQNKYNNPQSQMQRLKQGGLNPNLVYGQSSGAAAGNAGAIQSATAKSPQFDSPDLSGLSNSGGLAVNAYYDAQVKQAQTNNIEADTNTKFQEALLKAAQIQATTSSTKKTGVETEILNSIKAYSGDGAKAAVDLKKAQIDSTISDTDRKNAMHSKNMEQAMLNILKTTKGLNATDAQIRQAIADAKLKEQEHQLAKQGIYKNDPMWMRMLIKNKSAIMQALKNSFNPFKN